MKKELIGVGFVILIAILVFYSYQYVQRTDMSEKINEHSLPKATVKGSGGAIKTAQGSYCWDTLTVNKCVDKIGPIELIQFNKIKPTIVKQSDKITINYNQKPFKDSIVVEYWNDDSVAKVSIKNNQIVAPKKKGIYVYHLSGRWKQGSASQVFAIEVK